MRLARSVAVLLAVMTAPAWAQGDGGLDVPIMYGGQAFGDACGGSGDVQGLDPLGDNFLSVRSGPGGHQFHEIDRITNGQHVFVCDTQGLWLGVIYDLGSGGVDCGLSADVPTRTPYLGPCQSGWISSKFVGQAPN